MTDSSQDPCASFQTEHALTPDPHPPTPSQDPGQRPRPCVGPDCDGHTAQLGRDEGHPAPRGTWPCLHPQELRPGHVRKARPGPQGAAALTRRPT